MGDSLHEILTAIWDQTLNWRESSQKQMWRDMSGRLFKYVDTAHKNRETTAGLNKIRGIARTLEIASSALSLKQYNEWLCFVVRWGVVATVATRSLRINKCAEHQLHGGGWGQEMRNYSKQSEIFHSLTTHTPTRLCAKPPPIQCSTTNT